MINLMKYEVRKSMLSKIVLLVAIGIAQLLFLYGLFCTDSTESPIMSFGVAGLVLCAICGIGFIGIESILTLYKDMNTKQSYMLFMTPHNSFQILGAKILENGFAILTTGAFFALLAAIDLTSIFAKYGSWKELFEFLQTFFGFDIDFQYIGRTVCIFFFEGLVTWILTIVIGYLAITLSSSVFAGRKLNGIVSFFLFILINGLLDKGLISLSSRFPDSMTDITRFLLILLMELIAAVGVYVATSILIEKKLSV